MKLTQLLFLLCFCPSLMYAQSFYKNGSFVINGQVKNFKEPVFDFGMTTYLGNTSNSVKVQQDGGFEQQFPLQHRQDIYLYLNNDAITFTVQDKDTITLEWDAADFKTTFSVKGVNEPRTQELQKQLKLYYEFRKPFSEMNKSLYEPGVTDQKKFGLINELFNRNLQAVFDSSSELSENSDYLITSIYFQYSNLLLNQRLIPKYKLEFALDTTRTYPFFDVAEISADYTQLNELWFWNIPGYREFIDNYLRFYKPFNTSVYLTGSLTKPFNPTLDEYSQAQANIFVNNIKDWFVTKSIMMGFRYYTFGDVEKVYKQALGVVGSPYLKDTLQKYYTAIKRLKPGSVAPGFSLKNDRGQTVSLSDFKGKVVYIDFWGVGCGPCIYDIKNYVPKLHEHYEKKEVVFINICVDSNEKEWKDALEKHKLDGVNLIAEGWTKHPVCKAYNIAGIPDYILIDKNGKIANNNAPRAGDFDLTSGKNEIDLLLK